MTGVLFGIALAVWISIAIAMAVICEETERRQRVAMARAIRDGLRKTRAARRGGARRDFPERTRGATPWD